ncbi:MAG: oligosaccharide flippase family protein [Oscillatoriophycideae cyanobacterium NC_groundwater_1537_Pr4_S-0.65um_50_18]|nr:oligosaccharide flippase family protein [Oscillatoriophycideae cyanobacterium NC_groundwater_1537_Pr4_S-0.65um_50_18]
MSSTGASSMKNLAIRGAIWTIAGYGAGQILRFGSNLVLTRLLFPDLFGLMSLVYVFIAGLHLFSDLGIHTSVVQNKRGDEPSFLNTAWTLQVIRGAGLWILCLVLAVPVSRLYNEPQLLWLLPIVGFNTIIAGFNSTSLFTLNRHLSIKQLAIFEFSGQFISILVMLIWAWFSPTIWSLVVGGLTSSLFQMLWSHKLNSGKVNRFAWDKSSIHEIVSFGKWIFISTALSFLASQADRLILGKLFTLELLGIYGVAFTLSDIPRQIVLAISGKVIFPTYSKLIELPRAEFLSKIQRSRGYILIALAIVLSVIVSFGDLLVATLYDSRYAAARWMLPFLALGTWPIMLTQTIDPVLFAIGKPRYIALGAFLSSCCFIIGIPVGFSLYGPLGAVLSVAVSNIPPWVVVAYALWREQLSVIRQDAVVTLVFGGAIATLLLARSMLGLDSPFNQLFL